jgi:hypothetical protein
MVIEDEDHARRFRNFSQLEEGSMESFGGAETVFALDSDELVNAWRFGVDHG